MNSKTDSKLSVSPTLKEKAWLAADTETYWVSPDCKGLRSIQIYGSLKGFPIEKLIVAGDYRSTDLLIRLDICKQFFDWLESFEVDVELAFFNIDFDASQFILYLCRYSGYEFVYDDPNYWYLPKGHCQILESERTMYSISLRTPKGRLVHMVDLANFLPGSSLDSACKSWIGKEKVKLDSKRFTKTKPEGLELEYAMEDARLTYELFMELKDRGVIENQRTVTIAGRTIRHFQDYLQDEWKCRFNDFFYPGLDKEEIEIAKQRFEEIMRPSVRGGITMAVHQGYFEHCRHIDARSMYPTQCVKPWIPYGELLDEKPDGPCFEIVFPSGFFVLKDGKIPYFQWRSHHQTARYHYIHDYQPGEYVKDCYLDGSYMLWSDEWEIVQGSYEGEDVRIERRYWLRAMENRALKSYIEMLYKGKQENTGSIKLYYKILLNSLYGKFLSRPDGTVIHYIDGQRVKVDEDDRRTYYLPLGAWIAAGGRVQLYKAMSSIPVENVLYCDTDSIIYSGDRDPEATLGKNLGEWSMEAEDVDVWIIGPKAYQERDRDGNVLTKCAGMPRDIAANLPFMELAEGLKVDCFKPRRDPLTMAINIEPTTFEVSTRAQIFKSR